jgi:hypothetical protein
MAIDPAAPTDEDSNAKPDRPSVLLGIVTIALVAATAWLRFGPGLWKAPPAVGSHLPPTRLERLRGAEQLLLLGVEGRVTWLVFLSAESAEGRALLPQLEAVWKRLRPTKRFAMVAAAVEPDAPGPLRTALAEYEAKDRMPVYLADPDARRAFGVDGADPPWHFLVDPEGRIATIARGSGKDMIDRLAKQSSRWLEAMEPLDDAHFARTDPGPGPDRGMALSARAAAASVGSLRFAARGTDR